jgi:excisionase family DNA binding protein
MREANRMARSTRSAPIDDKDADQMRSDPNQPDRAAYTVPEAARLLGLSRGNAYALVRAGAIPAMRIGGRWIVPKHRFHSWLDQQSTAGAR